VFWDRRGICAVDRDGRFNITGEYARIWKVGAVVYLSLSLEILKKMAKKAQLKEPVVRSALNGVKP